MKKNISILALFLTFALAMFPMSALAESTPSYEVPKNQYSFDGVAQFGSANDGIDFGELVGGGNLIYFGTYKHITDATAYYENPSLASSYTAPGTAWESDAHPILWRMADYENEGSLVLNSKYTLDSRQFHSNTNRGSSDYRNSDLRKWLNGDFFENAFSSGEATSIAPQDVLCFITDITVDEAIRGVFRGEEVFAHGDRVALGPITSTHYRLMFTINGRSGYVGDSDIKLLRNGRFSEELGLGNHMPYATTYNHVSGYTTSYNGVIPSICVKPQSVLFASEITDTGQLGAIMPDVVNYRIDQLAIGYVNVLGSINFSFSDLTQEESSAWWDAARATPKDLFKQLVYKLTIVNPNIKLLRVEFDGISISNGSGIPTEFDNTLTLTGAGSGHDKLAYKIVQATGSNRSIVGYGTGNASSLTIDTKELIEGGDYSLYVWAQKDNAINSHEGSEPMYFKLGTNLAVIPAPAIAAPTSSTVLVNGENVAFDAYNINGHNYFKLRDLAYTLSNTEKQFEVGFDNAQNAISLTSGEPYKEVGGEMASKGAGSKTANPTSSIIYLDGEEVSFAAYNIDNNNYFKLRDIGGTFDFGVDWDGARNTIVIDTSKGYAPE